MTAFTDSDEEKLSDTELGQAEQPTNKLGDLLKKIDELHQGTESAKRESLELLLEHRDEVSCFAVICLPFFSFVALIHYSNSLLQFGQNSDFLWRLIRAYCDIHDMSATMEEKKDHAATGNLINLLVTLLHFHSFIHLFVFVQHH